MKKRGLSVEKTTETRQKIILAALDAFIHSGFANSKIATIAASAGLGKGTIYSYFETKEKLFEGVIDYLIAETLIPIDSSLLPENQAVSAFILEKKLATMINIETSGRAQIARLILSEGNQFENIRALYRQKIYQPWNHEIAKLVEIAIARQELPSNTDAKTTAMLINAPVWMAMIHNGILSPEEHIDLLALFAANIRHIFRLP